MTDTDMTANRVKPPPPGRTGGILGTAFAWDTGRGSGRPLTGPASTAGPDLYRPHTGFLYHPSTGVASI